MTSMSLKRRVTEEGKFEGNWDFKEWSILRKELLCNTTLKKVAPFF